MKLVFLHGLGQSAESWKEVRNLLTDYPSEAIELFPSGVSNYQKAKERVYQQLAQETEPFVLIGLDWIVLRCCPGIRTILLRFTKSSSFDSVRMPA